ncbi:MAG: ABC transporter permease subunit [Nocardioidaceae bacterium]|nr:MAG: ABC transporter permease subunit [Nocardioidaceae bacterium]
MSRGRRHNWADKPATVFFRILQGAVLIFALLPPVIIVTLSFFGDVFVNFPPQRPTTDLYHQLVTTPAWRDSFVFTVKLAAPVAVLSILIAVPAVFALQRSAVKGKSVLQFIVLLPMLLPQTGFAIALYTVYLRMGWVNEFGPLTIAQVVTAIPIGFMIIYATLQRLPERVEFVAMALGSGRIRAMTDISLPLLIPAIMAAALFAIISVFDDVLLTTFLGGPDTITVSRAIFLMIQTKLNPVIVAVAATLTVVTTVLTLSALAARGRSNAVSVPDDSASEESA